MAEGNQYQHGGMAAWRNNGEGNNGGGENGVMAKAASA